MATKRGKGESAPVELDITVAKATIPADDSPEDQADDSAMVKELQAWYDRQMKHYEDRHKECKTNRKLVKGKTKDDKKIRANLIHSTSQGLLPFIYAKNPQISAVPSDSVNADRVPMVRNIARTLEIAVQQELTRGGLKKKAKACVRSVFATSFGWLKITYQEDIREDPEIKNRIRDAQVDIQQLNSLTAQVTDDQLGVDQLETKKEQLELLIQSLQDKVEVLVEKGITIDRLRTEDVIVDCSIDETDDYLRAPRICQRIFMTREKARTTFGDNMDLTGAKVYKDPGDIKESDTTAGGTETKDQEMILALEIWDITTNNVLTIIDGCKKYARPPFVPDKQGQRWYPFFALYFWPTDAEFWPMNLIDLIDELQEDYNNANEVRSDTRKKNKPFYLGDKGAIEFNDINKVKQSSIGEVVLVDPAGKPLNEYLVQQQPLRIDMQLFDTSYIRADMDMITGLQDAWRGAVLKPKTLGEAEIMQSGLGGRMGELQDTIEDFLADISKFTAEVLLQELDIDEARALAGPEAQWPTLDKEEIFDLVEIRIMAGTTTKPDKARDQQVWQEIIQPIQLLIDKIVQLREQRDQAMAAAMQQAMQPQPAPQPQPGMTPMAPQPAAPPALPPAAMIDYSAPYVALLKETLRRFDESLQVDQFLPADSGNMQGMQQMLNKLLAYAGIQVPGGNGSPEYGIDSGPIVPLTPQPPAA